jgi:predicted CopG family antitoxin
MTESISLSHENISYLDRLKKPGESYDDVIEMLLEDYKANFKGCAERAKEAWDEYQNGETLSLGDIKKKYGIE